MRQLLVILGLAIIGATLLMTGAEGQGSPIGVSLFVMGINSTQVDLELDWNLISLQVAPADPNVSVVLSSIGGEYVSVHHYNNSDSLDHWKVYNPALPGWVSQDLPELREDMGFWLRTNVSGTLDVNGSQLPSVTMPIGIDWNMVGYPTTVKKNITLALATIDANYSSVHMYNASDSLDKWKVYNPALPEWVSQDLNWMVPKMGYWIRGNNTDDLVIS